MLPDRAGKSAAATSLATAPALSLGAIISSTRAISFYAHLSSIFFEMSSFVSFIVTGLSWLFSLPWKLVDLASGVLQALKKNLSDPYFIDFHSELNATNVTQQTPRTEWINMGYWKVRSSTSALSTSASLNRTHPTFLLHAKARTELQLYIVEANTTARPHYSACIEAHHSSRVQIRWNGPRYVLFVYQGRHNSSYFFTLDVGHGCGDSLLLHLEHPSVPRPKRLFGITSQLQHYQRAVERTSERNPCSIDVTLVHGDAIYRGDTSTSSSLHPLDAKTYKDTYTSILALDCAYHFNSRRVFLEQSFTCLATGGRIALGDICFAPGSLSLTTRLMIALMGSMPRENVTTTDEYIATLREIGYVDVELEDITQDVFPGFVAFLKGRGLAFRILASHFERLVSRGMRFVIVSAARP